MSQPPKVIWYQMMQGETLLTSRKQLSGLQEQERLQELAQKAAADALAAAFAGMDDPAAAGGHPAVAGPKPPGVPPPAAAGPKPPGVPPPAAPAVYRVQKVIWPFQN